MNQHLLKGAGSLKEVPAWLEHTFPETRRTLILISPSVAQTPAGAKFLKALPQATVQEVPGDLLTLNKLQALHAKTTKSTYDLIVTLGGGTVIDAGKWLRHQQPRAPIQVAIPTTAGTGSEATSFAAFYHEGVKQSLEAPHLRPQGAVLDPELLNTLPTAAATAAALDALTQATESYWSNQASPESKQDALESIKHLLPNLIPYLRTRAPEACTAVQWGAHLSGKAIQVSRTTLAHSLSYPLTGHLGIDHGLAVFLMLPTVMQYNAEHPGLEPLWQTFQANSAAQAHSYLTQLANQLGIPLNLAHYGVTQAFIPELVREALSSTRAGNNPRVPHAPTLEALLKERL